ncbi:MAG: hypothetical protein K2M47_07385 [Clostridiales bacterium]|nr:hypothetical protein [Clostridiales bacterium]
MDIKGKYESNVQKIGLSCDAFSTGCLIMCLLFFVPYVANNGGTFVMWFLPLACIVPFAVMPLMYMAIHKYDTLLFGRYHFVMPISAFVAAPFFVMAWSAVGVGASQSCLVFFGILIFAVAIMIYRYCAFSVRARLGGVSIVDKYPVYEIVCAVGCVAAAVAFALFLRYDQATVYINTAYVMSGVTVLLALAQYLITFYGIPRLGGRRVESVKSVFYSFFGGLDVKMYLSALFFEAAYAIVAALLVYFGFVLNVGMYGIISVAATVIVVYGISAYFCARCIKRRSMKLSVMNIVCVTLPCGVLALLAALNKTGDGVLAGLIIAAVILGVGGAVAVRQTKLRLLTVKPRVTSGSVFILFDLTMFAAAGLALLVAAVVANVLQWSLSVTAFIYGFAIAVVLAAVAMILCSRPKRVPASVDEVAIGTGDNEA